jgi:hypothetical protein
MELAGPSRRLVASAILPRCGMNPEFYIDGTLEAHLMEFSHNADINWHYE